MNNKRKNTEKFPLRADVDSDEYINLIQLVANRRRGGGEKNEEKEVEKISRDEREGKEGNMMEEVDKNTEDM